MRKRCKNADEGVVLVAIQIAVDSDLSTERTVPPRSTHVQPGDASHALIQQGERERLGKTPPSSSTRALWWGRSVPTLQGSARHGGRGGGHGRGEGLRKEKKNFVCWAAPLPPLYIGEEGGLRPHLGFPPQGWRQPPNPSRVRPRGGEGGAPLGWALRPIWT